MKLKRLPKPIRRAEESTPDYTSKTYNQLEIAANLFSVLHTMEDDNTVKQIFIEPVVEAGLGIAIMDRIKKAAYKYQSNEF